MADYDRIKRNIQRMIDQGAPESDIDRYVEGEGVTPEMLRSGQQPVGTGEDMLRSFGTGLRTGVEGIAGAVGDVREAVRGGATALMDRFDAPEGVRKGVNFALDYATPFPGAPTRQQVTEQITDPLLGADRHQPQTTAGKYARTTGEFAPGIALGGGSLGARAVTNVLAPAIGSEFAGQMTEGTEAEPWARLGGAIVGSQVPGALRRLATPFPVSQGRRAQLGVLEREGVNLTPGQATGRRALMYRESELAGGRFAEIMDAQDRQLTRAFLRRAGIDADLATPDVLAQAYERMGRTFGQLATRNNINPDQRLLRDLRAGVARYENVTAETQRIPFIANIVDDITAHPGPIPGQWYQNVRSEIGEAIRGASRGELRALRHIQNALDDAMERTMQAAGRVDDMEAWREVRRHYRNFIPIEDAAVKAGAKAAEGILTPQNMRAALVKQSKRDYALARGEFDELTRAANEVMAKLPDSGTASRLNARNLGVGTMGVAGAGAGSFAGPFGAMGGAIAGAAIPHMAGRAALSGPGRAYLGNQALADLAMPGQGTSAAIAALLSRRDPMLTPLSSLAPVNQP